MSDAKQPSSVKSATNESGRLVVEYEDGSKVNLHSLMPVTSTSLTVIGGTSAGNKTSTSSGSKSSSSSSSSGKYSGGSSSSGKSYSSGGYSSGYTGGGYSSWSSNEPTKAFVAHGIEFWGTPKSGLDKVMFKEGDLIINCTGHAWTPKKPTPPKNFAKTSPEWLTLPEIPLSDPKPHNNGELAQQLLLDWPDMSPPPEAADLDFWGEIFAQAGENGITRIICCCQAGQGRTGTALSAFLLATGAFDEPDMAIDYIRENYNKKAVETKGQEKYLFDLIYETVEEDDNEESSGSTGKSL